jgi:hypothetical protein
MNTNDTGAAAEVSENAEEYSYSRRMPEDYSADFAGKTYREIQEMTNKDNRQLQGQAAFDWVIQRTKAVGEAYRREKAEEQAEAEAENPSSDRFADNDDDDGKIDIASTTAIQRLTDLVQARVEDAQRQRDASQSTKSPLPFVLPQGDVTQLLERQLASSAAMVESVARQLVEEDCSLAVCSEFMKGVTSLLGAGANVGKIVGQLRGQGGAVSETCHRVIVERVVRQGEGV